MDGEKIDGRALFDEQRARVRDAYMNGISDIMDRCIGEFILPGDQETILKDAAKFLVFVIVTKINDVRRHPPTRENLLAAYWPLEKAIKDELPATLRELAETIERADG